MPRSITTRSDGGTGLGLAIVQKLIELHGSSIELTSQEGVGSEFYFKLNLQRSVLPLKADIRLFKKLRNKTAILAEDNEINAMVMRELLRKWGIEIFRVTNGLDAVQIAKHKKVDFILMDIHMPKMNGFDATHSIRNTSNPNKSTPIFALTADITAANEDRYASYFNGFLLKPLQIERLFDALLNVSENQAVTKFHVID